MQSQQPAEAEYRFSIIIWAVFIMAILMDFVLMQVVTPSIVNENATLLAGMILAAVGLVAVSLLIKKGPLARVRAGQIIAMVLCDAAATLGVVAWFLTRSPKSYYPLAVGLAGMFLHFPARKETI